MARPLASIVVPTRDKAPRLRLTLLCLAGQRDVGRFEVVVVDDGSRDHTRAVAAEAARELPLLVVAGGSGDGSGDGTGRAAARNRGAASAGGDHLVFLDDDVLVGPTFLAEHLALSGRERFVHGRLRELPTAARLLHELEAAPAEALRHARDQVHGLVPGAGPRQRLVANALERAIEAMDAGELEDVAPWLGCVGANVSMARAAFEAAGGFDEGFGTLWGCEDLELGMRLHRSGLRRVLAPRALGVHLSHPRPGRWEEHAATLERFAALHPQPAVTALACLLEADGSPRRYVAAVAAGLGASPA